MNDEKNCLHVEQKDTVESGINFLICSTSQKFGHTFPFTS